MKMNIYSRQQVLHAGNSHRRVGHGLGEGADLVSAVARGSGALGGWLSLASAATVSAGTMAVHILRKFPMGHANPAVRAAFLVGREIGKKIRY